MGICPMWRGNVAVIFPEGHTFPNNMSHRASPAIVPPCQASTRVENSASSSVRIKGRPLNMTTTTGFPVFLSSRSIFFWQSGREGFTRLLASPLQEAGSPTVAIIRSASLVSAMALRMSESVGMENFPLYIQ